MAFLAEYWIEIVLILVAVAGLGYVFYLAYTKNLEKAQKILLLFVEEAERYIGSGQGQKKLQYVYEKFTDKYPILSIFISFEKFSKMVDKALDELEEFIKGKS